MKKAIIFDLDGTLWDSSASVCESWNIVFSRYPEITRRLTPADVQGFMGKTLDQIFPIALPDTPDELRRKALNECVHYELEYIAEHGGLRETLVELRRSYALIIVSNCQDGYIQDFLDFADMRGLFGDFESAGGTGLSKGENIKLVIERNSIDKAVYVGDTQGDLDSADFAGISFIRAAYGFGQDVPHQLGHPGGARHPVDHPARRRVLRASRKSRRNYLIYANYQDKCSSERYNISVSLH